MHAFTVLLSGLKAEEWLVDQAVISTAKHVTFGVCCSRALAADFDQHVHDLDLTLDPGSDC